MWAFAAADVSGDGERDDDDDGREARSYGQRPSHRSWNSSAASSRPNSIAYFRNYLRQSLFDKRPALDYRY